MSNAWLCLVLLAGCRFDTHARGAAACEVGDVCAVALCECATGQGCAADDCPAVACGAGAQTSFAVKLAAEQNLAETEVAVDVDLTGLGIDADCANLHFIDDGGEALPHWAENGCSQSPARVWVRVARVASSTVIYGVVGSERLHASDGAATFSMFDSLSSVSDWSLYRVAYQNAHDHGAGVGPLEGGTGTLLETYASCYSAPYDGVGVSLERDFELGADSYCLDVTVATSIRGFDYTTTAHAWSGVYAGNAEVEIERTCRGRNCRAAGFDEVLSVGGLTGSVTAEIYGQVSDCVDARHVFRNLRLRRCDGKPVVAAVQAAFICP